MVGVNDPGEIVDEPRARTSCGVIDTQEVRWEEEVEEVGVESCGSCGVT